MWYILFFCSKLLQSGESIASIVDITKTSPGSKPKTSSADKTEDDGHNSPPPPMTSNKKKTEENTERGLCDASLETGLDTSGISPPKKKK